MSIAAQPSWNGVPAVSYLFVDGGCVRAELDALSRRYFGLNGQVRLRWSSLQPQFTKIFYYDALPARLEGEDDRAYEQRNASVLDLHSELRQLNGFHVYEGDVRRARARKERPQQKKVDVMIAVDMLLHTFRRNMQAATLIASDLDFAPLLHALVREGMQVTLWHSPGVTTEELKAAADARREFSPRELRHALVTSNNKHLLPDWQSGILHYRQFPLLHDFTASDGSKVIVTGTENHFVCEVFSAAGNPQGYGAHHDARVLFLNAEERNNFTLQDASFERYGGRPEAGG